VEKNSFANDFMMSATRGRSVDRLSGRVGEEERLQPAMTNATTMPKRAALERHALPILHANMACFSQGLNA
jgi:hypothetical protein